MSTTIKLFSSGESFSFNATKKYLYAVYGKAVVQDFTDTYSSPDDLFPHDGLLPYDVVYPAYRVDYLDANGAVLNSEIHLIGAGYGLYDIVCEVYVPDDGTTTVSITAINSEITELYYNELDANKLIFLNSGSKLSFKEVNRYSSIENAWCKIDGTWRVIKYISIKVDGVFKTL